ncbi:DNA ligase D [Candidatus Nitrospira bockiana]
MSAVPDSFPLQHPDLAYEPKYDGIRVKILVLPGTGPGGARIWSRHGTLMTHHFPDLSEELDRLRRTLSAPIVTDGEIVAVDKEGRPGVFQDLQGRIGLLDPRPSDLSRMPVALIVFDLLLEDGADLRPFPLRKRRERLERVVGVFRSQRLQLSQLVKGDGRRLYEEAVNRGWEGIVSKRLDSPYRSGKRHPDWRKWKFELEQEFVVGGWTESENRPFRALLLGVYTEDGRLDYVGRMGKAFSEADLRALSRRLRELETPRCPFWNRPEPDAAPHWVKPAMVIEAKFNAWTRGGKLREATYLGLRPDVDPTSVRREPVVSAQPRHTDTKKHGLIAPARPMGGRPEPREESTLLTQLDDMLSGGGKGTLTFADGVTLAVDGLHRPVWPRLQITKGDLMRYYITIAPYLLPAIADRPLTYRPFPHGAEARPDRYHQRVKRDVPPGVRVEAFRGSEREYEPRFIGGSLATLLYLVQIDVISVDAWLSRVSSPDHPDLAVLDLDPMAGIPFEQVCEVAGWVHEELTAFKIPGFLKTSGATGLHVYIPLAPRTTWRESWQFCQLLAKLVTQKHARYATVERSIQGRGGKVYLDYLQNLPGKTMAAAYSARANAFAGVSAPLRWKELARGVRPEDVTMTTVGNRVKQVGDLWEELRATTGVDLHARAHQKVS